MLMYLLLYCFFPGCTSPAQPVRCTGWLGRSNCNRWFAPVPGLVDSSENVAQFVGDRFRGITCQGRCHKTLGLPILAAIQGQGSRTPMQNGTGRLGLRLFCGLLVTALE